MAFWSNIYNWFGGGTTRQKGLQIVGPSSYAEPSAVSVTEETAMQVSGVWACVKLISETIASLPTNFYRNTPEGRVLANDFYLAKLLNRKPNRYQTKVEFWETMVLNLVLYGNCYAKINKIGGQIRSIMPLMASQMEVSIAKDGAVLYQYTDGTDVNVYAAESIWHVKLFGNGVIGKSPLAFGRNMIGIGQATDTAVSKIYINGGKRSGVLSLDKLLTPEQRATLRENFSSLSTGTDDRLLVLEMGMKFDAISMSPQDIELLASRKFQLEEICRWFGVPSVLVNDTSGSTTWGSGIEQLVNGFYKLNLRPYLERFESSVDLHLLTDAESAEYDFEFDFEGLLRTDFKSRLEAYRTAVAGTILTPNEARKLEGLESMVGGDKLLSQVNMTTIDKLGADTGTIAPIPAV